MNKVIEVNFIKKKNQINSKYSRSIIEETLESHIYDEFKEKFLNRNVIYNIEKKNKSEKLLCDIIKRIFTLNNKIAIVHLINSIYNDGWDINNTALTILEDFNLSKKIEIAYDLLLILENEYQQAQYKIVLNVKDCDNLAIIIYRELNEDSVENILSIFKNNLDYNEKNKLFNKNNNPYILMLNSNMLVPDVLDLTLNNNDKTFFYKFNILKGWKYDLKSVYESNCYLLLPLKIFDLGKRIYNMLYDFIDDETISFEVKRFFVEMNKYLNKLKDSAFLTQEAIYEANVICFEILNNIYEDIDTSEISRQILKEVSILNN